MSTTLETPPASPDATDLDAAVERLLGDAVTFLELLSVWLGLRLDLYAAMRGRSVTSDELAERARIAPRYAREWLEQQTVAGFVTCVEPGAPADLRAFTLPETIATVLLDAEGGAHFGPLVDMVLGTASVIEPLVGAYRTGAGVPYAEYGVGIRHGIGGLNGPTFDQQLPDWMRRMPDIDQRLRATGEPRILDLGCGVGRSSLALARTYPRATVRGVDLDPASIDEARAAASTAGLAHRVTFTRGDAADPADPAEPAPYDLVTIFEALHDVGDPVGTLRAARLQLAPGGAVYVADEKVAHAFTPDAEIVERLQFGFSALHCLPATIAEDPVVAHGTVLRMPTLVAWAQDAGFADVRDLEIEDLFWRHYRLDVGSRS